MARDPFTPGPHFPCVVVFGGNNYPEGSVVFQAAEALGRAFAGRGWTVANGGYGGTMLASARGAAQAGGQTIGVICSIFKSNPNPFIRETIQTDSLLQRLQTLIDIGDAYIVLPGSTGTLVELAMVWELMNKHMMAVKPVLCWERFWHPVVDIFSGESMQDPHVAALGVKERRGELIEFIDSADAAIERLVSHFNSINR